MSISFVDKKTFDKCWEKFVKETWDAPDETKAFTMVYGSFIKTYINKKDFKTKFGSFKVAKIMVAEVLPYENKEWHDYIEPNEHLKYSDEMIAARLKRGLNGETDNIIWGDAIVQVYKNWTGPMTPLEDIKFNGNDFN